MTELASYFEVSTVTALSIAVLRAALLAARVRLVMLFISDRYALSSSLWDGFPARVCSAVVKAALKGCQLSVVYLADTYLAARAVSEFKRLRSTVTALLEKVVIA